MAYVVTNDQHYSDIADAIRAKGISGTFKPDEMASAVGQIRTGIEAKYNSDGKIYTEHVVVPDHFASLPANCYAVKGIITIDLNNVSQIGHYACGDGNKNLKILKCPVLTSFGSYLSWGAEALETLVLGSIGHPVTSLPGINWLGTTSGRSSAAGGFTATIYVDAMQISDIPAEVTQNPMGGSAAYCTALIYRNSTTGEVLEG